MKRFIWIFLCLGLFFSVLTVAASAATVSESASAGYLMDVFTSKTQDIEAEVLKYTRYLWNALFVLSFTWAMIQLALGGTLTLETFLQTIIRHMFYGFFFLVLIDNPAWIHDIYKGFGTIGTIISKGVGGPQDVISAGIQIFEAIYTTIKGMGNAVTILALIIGLMPIACVIVCCFCVAGAAYMLMKIEALIIISVGVIMLGFGGAVATRDMAIAYLKYTITYGIKLITLKVLVGIMTHIIDVWINALPSLAGTAFIAYVLQLLGATFIFLMLVLKLPNIVSGIISGVSMGSVGDLAAAGMAASTGGRAINAAGSMMSSPTGGALRVAGGAAMGAVAGAIQVAQMVGNRKRNQIEPGDPLAAQETGKNHSNYVPPPTA